MAVNKQDTRDRASLARMFFDDAFRSSENLLVDWVEDQHWDKAKFDNEWNDYGINPGSYDPDRNKIVVLVNLRDLLTGAKNVEDDLFPRYLLYWKVRIQLRLLAEDELGIEEEEDRIDELAGVKAATLGLEKWWDESV